MCTTGDQAPGSIAEALRVVHAGLDYLNSPDAAGLPAPALGGVLASLGEIQAKLTAAHAAFLRRFDAADAHDGDGYATSSAWLAAMTQLAGKDAKAAVARMRRLGEHPRLEEALARGEISWSWAAEIIDQTRKLPPELRGDTGKILVEAAAGGASLQDLKTLADCAYEKWRSQHPDPDDGDGFDDRYVQVSTTFGGAGCIRGNLTPECNAAVQAVLEALGKRQGPEDHRTEGQRFHDALQLGCELLIRAKMVPDRAGADTQVLVHMLSQLRGLPGASALEAAWLGGPGYLGGKDAEAAACDALTVPAVTGHADMTVIDRIIDLALADGNRTWHGDVPSNSGTARGDTGDDSGGNGSGDTGDDSGGTAGGETDSDGTGNGGDSDTASGSGRDSDTASSGTARGGGGSGGGSGGRVRYKALSPQAYAALRYAIARLAVEFLSGPAGLAAILRTGLLEEPYNTPSLPLDIGYSDTIPAHIRRAVMLRDRACAWPRCRRPAVYCDVHHIRHKKDGGKTSAADCVLLCQFHHDVCIHRWGWQIILHPDGTTEARSPDGRILRSHAPPTLRAG